MVSVYGIPGYASLERRRPSLEKTIETDLRIQIPGHEALEMVEKQGESIVRTAAAGSAFPPGFAGGTGKLPPIPGCDEQKRWS